MDYLEQHNANPKPFVWTASAGAILEKVARAKQALESATEDSFARSRSYWSLFNSLRRRTSASKAERLPAQPRRLVRRSIELVCSIEFASLPNGVSVTRILDAGKEPPVDSTGELLRRRAVGGISVSANDEWKLLHGQRMARARPTRALPITSRPAPA